MERKRIKFILCISLIALTCFFCVACQLNGKASIASEENQNEKTEINYKDKVKLAFKEEIKTKNYDGSDNNFPFIYKAPEILDDSKDAKKINAKIYTMVQEYADQSKTGEPDVAFVDYKLYSKGEKISIVIQKKGFYTDFDEYDVYNYDFETKKQISNEELLKDYGITEKEFIKESNRKLVQTFDKMFVDLPKEKVKDYYTNFVPLRAGSIASNKLKDAKVFFDNENIGQMATIFGVPESGMGYEHITIKPSKVKKQKNEEAHKIIKTASYKDGYIVAKVYGENVTVEITDEDGSLAELEPKCEKEIKVKNTYSTYKDAKIVDLDGKDTPYLFLLDENGNVEFVNITRSIIASNYYSALPVPGLGKVHEFSIKKVDSEKMAKYKKYMQKLKRVKKISMNM